MNITAEQLRELLPRNTNPEAWVEPLNTILPKYGIDTPNRIAAFISQCAHESADFTVLQENLHYRAATLLKVFPKYFKSLTQAQEFANTPEKIANRVYANRMKNGDEASGDGYKYRGRGLIQLTGRDNYEKFAASVGKTLDETVIYLETLDGALESACWYWSTRDLNELADAGDTMTITRRINGGLIGLEERTAKFDSASEILA